MRILSTKAVEEIYSMLERYADASSSYYDREGFIYSFGVIPNPPKKMRLRCFDNKSRTFVRDGDSYILKGGLNNQKINSLIRQIIADNSNVKQINDLNVIETRV